MSAARRPAARSGRPGSCWARWPGWFLLATATALGQPFLPGPGEAWSAWDVALAVPVAASQVAVWIHAWLAPRRFHGRGVWSTTWRILALVVLHSLILFGLFSLLG